MDKTYKSVIEAIIFSSDEPISENEIIHAIKGIDGEEIEIDSDDVHSAVEELNNKYDDKGNSFNIEKIANGFIICHNRNKCKVCRLSIFRKI